MVETHLQLLHCEACQAHAGIKYVELRGALPPPDRRVLQAPLKGLRDCFADELLQKNQLLARPAVCRVVGMATFEHSLSAVSICGHWTLSTASNVIGLAR